MKKIAIGLLLAACSGCFIFDSMSRGAGDQYGRNVGAGMVGNAGYSQGQSMSMATMNPAFMNMYMSSIFAMAFSSGGYDVSQVDYKPGQYTRWNGHGQNNKGAVIERAHLFDDAQGRQWWKVKFTDSESNKTTILEGLLDPQTHKFVRMRAKFPDDAQGNELAVTDQNYYQPPTKLTKDSIDGATKGVESVTVPAGTFTAKHVVFGGGAGTNEWWLVDSVPGGVVKQLGQSQRSGQGWEMDLAASGSDAQSELGITK